MRANRAFSLDWQSLKVPKRLMGTLNRRYEFLRNIPSVTKSIRSRAEPF